MTVLAALGDAPTAAIAVVAILLGVLFAARGPRDKRAAVSAEGEERAPMMVASLPVAAAPEPEPGFVGPEGEVVGHGPIRLGVSGPLGGGEGTEREPAQPEPAFFAAPPTIPEPLAGAVALPDATPSPQAPSAPATDPPAPPGEAAPEPAWRVAARAANPAVHFRQGTIKLGGKPADKSPDQ